MDRRRHRDDAEGEARADKADDAAEAADGEQGERPAEGLGRLAEVLATSRVSFLSWIVNRFSDGLTPQARALNKETRRKAQEYLASKRD